MAKPVPLTAAALQVPQITPLAATLQRTPSATEKSAAVEVEQPPKEPQVPLQIRIPKSTARAIKIAAAEEELTISDFMIACFHARMKGDGPR